MTTLREHTKAHVKNRKQYLREAKEALVALDELPGGLEGVPASSYADITNNILYINLSETDGNTVKTAKMAGVIGLKSRMNLFGNWQMEGGRIALPSGREVHVTIYGTEKPPQCRVEEYQETVTRYKAICEETGEEL